MKKPRINRPKKVEINVESHILSLIEERSIIKETDEQTNITINKTIVNRNIDYKKPDTLCKITIANIRETKARRVSRQLVAVICDGFGVKFGYNF